MTDSISTISSQRALEDYSQLFDNLKNQTSPTIKTASPPLFSNIVLKTVHDANIDLNVLFNILPIIKLTPTELKEKSSKFNEIFISVRKYPKFRGYRGPSNIKSFLDMDFYMMNRNFHLKVSTHKISIVGGGSVEISKTLIDTIYHHLISYNNKWVTFHNLSIDKREEICKLFEDNTPPTNPEDMEFYEVLDSIIDRENENVHERLCDINPIIGKSLYENEPKFSNLVNCNSVYNYHLPEEISLIEKANTLYHKGYEVMYHNFVIVKCMKAKWVDPKNGNRFSFSIQNIGTIKQNSSCNIEDSNFMYEKIIRDLGFEPYKEGKDFTIKPKNKIGETVVKNKKCINILDKYLKIDE